MLCHGVPEIALRALYCFNRRWYCKFARHPTKPAHNPPSKDRGCNVVPRDAGEHTARTFTHAHKGRLLYTMVSAEPRALASACKYVGIVTIRWCSNRPRAPTARPSPRPRTLQAPSSWAKRPKCTLPLPNTCSPPPSTCSPRSM